MKLIGKKKIQQNQKLVLQKDSIPVVIFSRCCMAINKLTQNFFKS